LSAVPLPFPGEIAGDSPTMATGVHAAGLSPAPAEAPCSPVSPLEAAGTDYERVRAARIRENMERMRKLGILDLAHTLTSSSLAAAAAGSGSGGGAGRGRPRRKPVEPGSDGPPPPKAKPALRSPARRSLRYGPHRIESNRPLGPLGACPGSLLGTLARFLGEPVSEVVGLPNARVPRLQDPLICAEQLVHLELWLEYSDLLQRTVVTMLDFSKLWPEIVRLRFLSLQWS